MPFEYKPFVNRYVGTMSDLMAQKVEARNRAALSAAEVEAGAVRRVGDLTAAKWSGLGQDVAGGVESYLTEKREAPLRAAELAELELPAEIRAAYGRIDSASRNPDGSINLPAQLESAREELRMYPQELMRFEDALIDRREASELQYGDYITRLMPDETGRQRPVSMREVFDPVKGERWHEDFERNRVEEPSQPMPGDQVQVMRDGTPTWILKGTAIPGDVEIPDPAAMPALGTPASRIQNALDVFEKVNSRPPTIEEKTEIEARIAEAAQPTRAGYFTMGTAYDPQGRPTGSIVLDARTGLTRFVTIAELGGYPARPPGNLAQRTIENEAALDSLGRLEQMFTAGAAEDIGPAEGRMRRAVQGMPLGVAMLELLGQDTPRFANFEAATRGFQNAMIKAITGAQMSEPEAKRIMGQIPAVEDNPVVWAAKYDQSVVNLKDLEFRLRSDRDAGRDELAPALDAEGRPIDYGAIFREATGLDIEEDDGLGGALELYRSLEGGR
jgi:hypothetical protein